MFICLFIVCKVDFLPGLEISNMFKTDLKKMYFLHINKFINFIFYWKIAPLNGPIYSMLAFCLLSIIKE